MRPITAFIFLNFSSKKGDLMTFKTFQASAAVAMLTTLFCTPAQAVETLTVYTALEADQIKPYQAAFESKNPDIKLKWVTASHGILTAKLLAEKANPQADVIMSLAASSLALLKKERLLFAYAPKNVEKLTPAYVDNNKPPFWVGTAVWGATVCFNTIEAAKLGIKKPETWQDLTKPEFKGKIVMPNPASSGTGYFDVSAWLQSMGEAKGWALMDKLHANIAQYTHSGSKPCKQAATGEFLVGISFEHRAAKLKASGAPIELIFPKEGLGWDIEATAILKNTKKMAAAQRFADWAASPAAHQLYASNVAIVALPSAIKPSQFIPQDYQKRLIKQDLTWSANNRSRVLAEWSKRYDSKTEAK
jgi:iron(III) transport system substrate-binding protein